MRAVIAFSVLILLALGAGFGLVFGFAGWWRSDAYYQKSACSNDLKDVSIVCLILGVNCLINFLLILYFL